VSELRAAATAIVSGFTVSTFTFALFSAPATRWIHCSDSHA
jgi:hypothetical protein